MIDAFDKLTSGRRIARIDFTTAHFEAGPQGARVGFAEDNGPFDVWIGHDESGIWLTGNALHIGADGFHAFEEPLSAVRGVWFTVA